MVTKQKYARHKNNTEVYRFCRMPFEIISSPLLLVATIDHHLKRCNNNIASKIRDNIYVDNIITKTRSADKAKQCSQIDLKGGSSEFARMDVKP